LFVNPKQFGAGEDLDSYPRDEAGDAARLAAEGADLLFQPGPGEIYPSGFATSVAVEGLGDVLEGEHRPGFFTGVATVVTKLLLQSLPDIAVFGEKDYQQLLVIKRLVRDLDIPVRIEAAAIVREDDGLAMSSRNAYLSPAERAIAGTLNAVLAGVAERLAGGEVTAGALAWGRERLAAAGFAAVEYLELRDAETLAPVEAPERPARLLAAVRIGPARLIDNIAVPPR
jgi:pantoate--beta-alanine ligase